MTATIEIKQKIQPLLKRHHVSVAYLFGSAARDTAGPSSDIDIAVLFQPYGTPTSKHYIRAARLASELEDVTQKTIDIIDLAEIESPLLRHRAIRRGQLIYCADNQQRIALEQKALHDYEDTRHLRELQQQIMQRHIETGTFGHAP